jgi:hypothetical protein
MDFWLQLPWLDLSEVNSFTEVDIHTCGLSWLIIKSNSMVTERFPQYLNIQVTVSNPATRVQLPLGANFWNFPLGLCPILKSCCTIQMFDLAF